MNEDWVLGILSNLESELKLEVNKSAMNNWYMLTFPVLDGTLELEVEYIEDIGNV